MSHKITRNGVSYRCMEIEIELRDVTSKYGLFEPVPIYYDIRLKRITDPPGVREIVLPIDQGDSLHIEREDR